MYHNAKSNGTAPFVSRSRYSSNKITLKCKVNEVLQEVGRVITYQRMRRFTTDNGKREVSDVPTVNSKTIERGLLFNPHCLVNTTEQEILFQVTQSIFILLFWEDIWKRSDYEGQDSEVCLKQVNEETIKCCFWLVNTASSSEKIRNIIIQTKLNF